MESSSYMGMVAVVAVSGSVALVALQLHKRLMVDFLKKVQLEIGHRDHHEGTLKTTTTTTTTTTITTTTVRVKNETEPEKKKKKKKVTFAADVVEPSSDNKEYRRRMSSPRLVVA